MPELPRILWTVQHHPRRSYLLPDLLPQLPRETLVIEDPDPQGPKKPWRTYRACLEAARTDHTHLVVLQDDVHPCRGFAEIVPTIVAARPARLISFFVGGRPSTHGKAVRDAANVGLPWAELVGGGWCPAVALCWPVTMILPLLEYIDSQRFPLHYGADDEIIGRYLRVSGLRALATAPSLIEHPDMEPSLIGGRTAHGRDKGRVAACWIPDNCDPALIDWSAGPQ